MSRATFAKGHILAEIRRTTGANGGVPLGRRRFEQETGVKESDWSGRYWATWGEAVSEAGYSPNARKARRESEELLGPLAALTRRLKRFPTRAQMRLAARADSGFPVSGIEKRYRDRGSQLAALVEYCRSRGELEDVLGICASRSASVDGSADETSDAGDAAEAGYVYLLKSGRNYKIGRSNSVGRRERELQIQLPDRASAVHAIKTDDPEGIERYWHGRFALRRKNGEWFQLSADDIRAFRRRKFM